MNIFGEIGAQIVAHAARLFGDEAARTLHGHTPSPPRDENHGDIASNAAMILAKSLRRPPRDIAAALAGALGNDEGIAAASMAGAGFVNITLDAQARARILRSILENGADFARPASSEKLKINVEYVSANPTGPLHIGHCRGAVFGDVMAGLLAFAGHEVTREYYVNDAGAQTDILARSALLRYREALGEEIGPFPEGHYPGDYLIEVGHALAKTHGNALREKPAGAQTEIARKAALKAMLVLIRRDLADMGIRHDIFFHETGLHGAGGAIENIIAEFERRDLIYQGRIDRPKGFDDGAWEAREQRLFRASDFGDDSDRAVQKSDGSYTYFAADIAYLKSKFTRHFDVALYVLGADHSGYVTRLEAIAGALGKGMARAPQIVVRQCQLVTCLRDGKPVSMSKRSGNFIALADVIGEVGSDALRFIMLTRKNDAPLEFDFAQVRTQSRDNPVFYVQYAHARAASVLRQASEMFSTHELTDKALGTAGFAQLDDVEEARLVLRLAAWPRTVALATAHYEPHRIAFYLTDLAAQFHSRWNQGNKSSQLRFINLEDQQLSYARLGLVRAVMCVISQGLDLLGVSAPHQMR